MDAHRHPAHHHRRRDTAVTIVISLGVVAMTALAAWTIGSGPA
jgi:hypothetical protein